jgi:threonylcarbamoyladenosine tRNA methylthiotransferase MtaB
MRYHNCVPTYHVENFGCRATQADGAALERQFEARGLAHASAAQADVVLLNTCTVTAAADQDARAAIRRVRRQNPLAKIVVTGCYAQRAPEEIAALPGVTAVIGNSHKHQLAEIVLQGLFTNRKGHNINGEEAREGHDFSRAENAVRLKPALAAEVDSQPTPQAFIPLQALGENRELGTEDRIYVSDIFAHTELFAAPVFESANNHSRTRPNLKVQDGCDNRCSFCVIPSVRGHSRSLPQLDILREVAALVAAGYKELVISGINLGRWGFDLMGGGHSLRQAQGTLCPPNAAPSKHSRPFENLLQAILEETTLEKLRISSVEPMDWTDSLISLVASSPRIARHAHVPLQSGSDAVLRRMHRKYRPWHYREKIEKIRAAMPTAAIGADVMVGFPGETASEFDATHRLLEELPFTYLHVFTYSPRPGTPAAALPNLVPIDIARERNKILRDLAHQKKLAFMQSFLGQRLQAITLGASPIYSGSSFTEALTDNYLRLFLQGSHASNQWLSVEIGSVADGVFFASPAVPQPWAR